MIFYCVKVGINFFKGGKDAIKTNPACKALYECLRANGKTGKQALIAVCNKFLKQVFVPIAIGIKMILCINPIIVLQSGKKS
jgi:hypothetical protein